MSNVRSDIGPFAVVPLWLFQIGLSPAALTVWTVLSSRASQSVWGIRKDQRKREHGGALPRHNQKVG